MPTKIQGWSNCEHDKHSSVLVNPCQWQSATVHRVALDATYSTPCSLKNLQTSWNHPLMHCSVKCASGTTNWFCIALGTNGWRFRNAANWSIIHKLSFSIIIWQTILGYGNAPTRQLYKPITQQLFFQCELMLKKDQACFLACMCHCYNPGELFCVYHIAKRLYEHLYHLVQIHVQLALVQVHTSYALQQFTSCLWSGWCGFNTRRKAPAVVFGTSQLSAHSASFSLSETTSHSWELLSSWLYSVSSPLRSWSFSSSLQYLSGWSQSSLLGLFILCFWMYCVTTASWLWQ